MKFEEALSNFTHELIKEYGIDDPITKIGIDPKVLDRIYVELAEDRTYTDFSLSCRISTSSLNEFSLRGVRIVARKKDNF